MAQAQTDHITVPVQLKQQLEEAAKRLNISVAAYLLYTHMRGQMTPAEAARLDRNVSEVFGKHGELIRRLAQ